MVGGGICSIALGNVFDPEVAARNPSLINEVENDMGTECSNAGPIETLFVVRREGSVIVTFSDIPQRPAAVSVASCIAVMHGRWYSERQLTCEVFSEPEFRAAAACFEAIVDLPTPEVAKPAAIEVADRSHTLVAAEPCSQSATTPAIAPAQALRVCSSTSADASATVLAVPLPASAPAETEAPTELRVGAICKAPRLDTFAVAMCDVEIMHLQVDEANVAESFADVRWLQPRQRSELRSTRRLLARKLHR
jgi:hypothetical protein